MNNFVLIRVAGSINGFIFNSFIIFQFVLLAEVFGIFLLLISMVPVDIFVKFQLIPSSLTYAEI